MNNIKRKIRVVTFLILAVSAISALVLSLMPGTLKFLSLTKRVNANVLVVEGWMPQKYMELAYNEFIRQGYELILTTGIKSPDLDFCQVAMNGYLIFYPDFSRANTRISSDHYIEVIAHSEMGGKYSCHFNFFVNDSLVKDFVADEKIRSYGIAWSGPLEGIDSLMFQFDNDEVDDYGDRNLYIKEVVIDKEIVIPYQFNSLFDQGRLDNKNRILNNYNSIAEVARNNFINLGVDPARIEAVPGNRTRVNRTLTSAIAIVTWLKKTEVNITGINIISRGIHSRRTWITYRKLIHKPVKVGIISLPEPIDKKSSKIKYGDRVTELLSFIYYEVILVPYALII